MAARSGAAPAREESIRVLLERMNGKQDVSNERLEAIRTDVSDIRKTVADHGERIHALENDKTLRDGERKGFGLAARVVWAVGGSGLTGAAVLIARTLLPH